MGNLHIGFRWGKIKSHSLLSNTVVRTVQIRARVVNQFYGNNQGKVG